MHLQMAHLSIIHHVLKTFSHTGVFTENAHLELCHTRLCTSKLHEHKRSRLWALLPKRSMKKSFKHCCHKHDEYVPFNRHNSYFLLKPEFQHFLLRTKECKKNQRERIKATVYIFPTHAAHSAFPWKNMITDTFIVN